MVANSHGVARGSFTRTDCGTLGTAHILPPLPHFPAVRIAAAQGLLAASSAGARGLSAARLPLEPTSAGP